ncbi:hypothetical protein [Paractinoplanes hotanensis]|uniref:Uncharacterized protein n=1 Tax=Paractinoplanes hotanensis TaxID=2906497 RepID=A0ABT0Y4Y0_9ACTN|nr:hypothetical protein [Actinoplanes hotanensis]MCM4081072.1 hypothetical protein [Actinoplanes hotanensis]
MSTPETDPEAPRSEPSKSDPVVDTEAKDDTTAEPGDPPADRETAGPEPPGEANTFEDADPEPRPADEDAARSDRRRGFASIMALSTGSHARSFQADQMNFYGGEPSAVPLHGPVPGTVLRRLESSYVETTSAPRLGEMLRVASVLCLVGPAGQGRTTTAIAVAIRYLRERGIKADGNVHILAAESGLAAVTENTVPRRKTLILTLPTDAPAPDVAWFGAMGKTFRDRDSVLIVVSVQTPTGSAVLRDELSVAYAAPDPEAVFRSHIGRLPAWQVDRIAGLDEVRRSVRRCRSPREATLLAVEVLDGVERGLPDSELLSGEPFDHVATAQKELQESELWNRILLVAATVMADLAAGTVAREALRLAEMHKPSGVQSEGPKVEWFTGAQRWAESIKFDEAPSEGSGRIVRLSHPRLAVPLLRVVWEEHVGERDVLLPWLYNLGLHPHKRVRVKAAQAVAQLACYDFDVVMREVLQVWALDGRFRSRESCAMELEALAVAADGRFAKRVRGQVQGWARSNNVALLAAAVAAYGTFLGAKDPDEALSRMREIAGARVSRIDGHRRAAEQAEQGLANIVQRAVIDVFTAGAQEKVIQALAGWAGVPSWRWRRAAARGLLELARKDGSGPWPLLVELSAVQERTYDAVLKLWRNALDAKHRDEASWHGLRRWLDQATELRGNDSARSLVALVDRLEQDLRSQSTDIAKHLDFHQRIWTFRDERRRRSGPTEETHR